MRVTSTNFMFQTMRTIVSKVKPYLPFVQRLVTEEALASVEIQSEVNDDGDSDSGIGFAQAAQNQWI